MYTLIVCLKRKPGLSRAEFLHYWRYVHGALIKESSNFNRHLMEYRQYHQSAPAEGLQALFGKVVDEYDGIAMLVFRSREAWQIAIKEPQYLASIRPDEYNFIDIKACKTFLMDAVAILPSEESGPAEITTTS